MKDKESPLGMRTQSDETNKTWLLSSKSDVSHRNQQSEDGTNTKRNDSKHKLRTMFASDKNNNDSIEFDNNFKFEELKEEAMNNIKQRQHEAKMTLLKAIMRSKTILSFGY